MLTTSNQLITSSTDSQSTNLRKIHRIVTGIKHVHTQSLQCVFILSTSCKNAHKLTSVRETKIEIVVCWIMTHCNLMRGYQILRRIYPSSLEVTCLSEMRMSCNIM